MDEGKPSISDVMAAYAVDAVEHAKARCGVVLDYSPESVREVERVLETAHAAIPRGILGKLFGRGPSQDDLRQMSMMYGGYLGEVLKKHRGGEWGQHAEHGLALIKGDDVIFPHGRVHKRLVNGSEDNVWVYFEMIARDWGGV